MLLLLTTANTECHQITRKTFRQSLRSTTARHLLLGPGAWPFRKAAPGEHWIGPPATTGLQEDPVQANAPTQLGELDFSCDIVPPFSPFVPFVTNSLHPFSISILSFPPPIPDGARYLCHGELQSRGRDPGQIQRRVVRRPGEDTSASSA